MAAFFPLTAVTYPKFVLYNHVLCFARIMSTLSELYCRQTARIGGGQLPPVPYACDYGQINSMWLSIKVVGIP